jgi:ElaB/YqjD/DUF883 family membrane-anchored ribosome-binding protein
MAQHGSGDDTGRLAADLAALKGELSRLAEAVAALVSAEGTLAGETLKRKAEDAAAKATETVEALKEAGHDALGQGEQQARKLAGELGGAIERNPMGAAAVAFGIGLLLGLLRSR